MPAPSTTSGLSTWCRGPDDSPADFGRRASDLGAPAIALDATLSPAWLAQLMAGGDTRALPVVAIEAPCPRPRSQRAPRLAAADKEERLLAVNQTHEAIELAQVTGARVVIVRLGRLEVKDGWRETVRELAVGRWKRSEAEQQLELRAQLAERARDHARFGIERLMQRAGDAGVTIALVNRARWFEIPDDHDTAALLDDFRGGPLAAWHDPAAAHARETLGHGLAADTLAALAPRAAGAWLTDAAGLLGGLPWGHGEASGPGATKGLPDGALRVVHCAPGATDRELAGAIATTA